MAHHLLAFGPITEAASLERLGRRWTGPVEVYHDPDVDSARAGVPTGGIALSRPDGYIGFRSSTTDAEALAALDHHPSSYLIPDPTA